MDDAARRVNPAVPAALLRLRERREDAARREASSRAAAERDAARAERDAAERLAAQRAALRHREAEALAGVQGRTLPAHWLDASRRELDAMAARAADLADRWAEAGVARERAAARERDARAALARRARDTHKWTSIAGRVRAARGSYQERTAELASEDEIAARRREAE